MSNLANRFRRPSRLKPGPILEALSGALEPVGNTLHHQNQYDAGQDKTDLLQRGFMSVFWCSEGIRSATAI